VVGPELIAEAKDAVGAGFGGVEVVFGAFEGSEAFDREVFWKAFDGEARRIVGHSIESWGDAPRGLIHGGDDAD